MESIKAALGMGKSGGKDAVKLQPPTDAELATLREKYAAADQEHVFTWWDDLTNGQKAQLYSQLLEIDPAAINDIARKARALSAAAASNASKDTDNDANDDDKDGDSTKKEDREEIAALPEGICGSTLTLSAEDRQGLWDSGLDLIGANKCAVVVLAGGQGTRLGSAAPKGCFDIGLPSHKSLFQLQAERVRKVAMLAEAEHADVAAAAASESKDGGKDRAARSETSAEKVVVPWYVMTSGPTRDATESFFRDNAFFGLAEEDVMLFDQGTLPCVRDADADAGEKNDKIMMEEKHRVSVAPDGNGGLYRALVTSGALDDMAKRGVEHVQVYCVDNCLAQVADPIFYGFAAGRKSHVATKVVRKTDPAESVGLVVMRVAKGEKKADVVEYSEIDEALAKQTEKIKAADGSDEEVLRLRAANIVQHYFNAAFLQDIPKWQSNLPHHVARKKIPHIDTRTGDRVVKPDKVTGTKFEQFIFDVFPICELSRFACLEVRREDEFAPLKNATGADSAQTARAMLLRQGRRFVQAAGGVSVGDGSEQGDDGVEVSPLISYAGEGLARYVGGKELRGRAYIEAASERKRQQS